MRALAGPTPKPSSGLSPLKFSPPPPPTLLLGLLCSSLCNGFCPPGCAPHEDISVSPDIFRHSEPRIILILSRRPRGQKSARLKGEGKEGQTGVEVAPPREAPPSLTTSLIPQRAGEARPTLPSRPGSESPVGERQLWPSRKPSLTWRGLGGGWWSLKPLLADPGGTGGDCQCWLSSQHLSRACQEVRSWPGSGSLRLEALTLEGRVRWECRSVHKSP